MRLALYISMKTTTNNKKENNMKYYKYYKVARELNPLIKAIHILAYLRRIELANNLDKAFNIQ